MPISRMQNPRQLYGLGSFVKKIGRGVKKVFKSPIGKAALLGLGAYGLGGGFGAGGFKFGNILGKAGMMRPGQGFGGGSGLMGLFSKAKNAIGGGGALSNLFGGSIGKGAMALGLGGGLASMMAKAPEEDEEEYIDRIRTLKPYLSKYYKNANPLASDEEVEDFLTTNLSEYGEGGAKDGGLIGYQEGGPVDEDVIEDQETVTEDVETPSGMEKLQETLTEVAKVLYRTHPATAGMRAGMFTYDEAKKIYEGLPDISKEMIHRIGKVLAMTVPPIALATAGGKGLAALLKGGIGQEDAQDLLGHREKVTRKKDKDPVGDLIDEGASFEEAVDISTLGQRQGAATGGLMDLGGYEKDYRMGGFVPLGKKEKADDVPARLSKNEFVFTADAVKAAGGGSVDKGAQKMYDTMKHLENRIA